MEALAKATMVLILQYVSINQCVVHLKHTHCYISIIFQQEKMNQES